jgi:ATP-dependent Clp protease adaptor protein ClpS
MSTDNDVVEEVKTKLKKPKKWAVVLHNDDVTPMDFVVELLYYVFKLEIQQATQLMIKIHTEGHGVAGVYPYEVAEQKLAEAQALVRISSMSLKITMEEE